MTEQAEPTEPTAINSKSDADWLFLCFYSKPRFLRLKGSNDSDLSARVVRLT